jgi:hypothetical protein
MIVLASGQRWSRPEPIASELLHSVQASSLGITPLPEPDTPAPIFSLRSNSLSSLAISELTTALGLEVTYSVSKIERSAILIDEGQFSTDRPDIYPRGVAHCSALHLSKNGLF